MSKALIALFENKMGGSRTPIWLMRQAGRYLPEYKKIRGKFSSFTEFFLNSNAAAEVTLQPLRRFDLDAAIVFSDILIVPHALGLEVAFGGTSRPIVLSGFDENFCLAKVKVNDEAFEAVKSTIKIAKKEMDRDFKHVGFIGFCGAPWTVAAYIVEGGSSKDFLKAKRFALENQKLFEKLLKKIIDATVVYVEMQIEAGAEVIKIFDSWAGILPWEQYENWVIKPTVSLINKIRSKYKNMPIIAFPRGSGSFYEQYSQKVRADVIAIDQNIDILWARKNIKDKILQGNLDNAILAYSKNLIKSETEKILDSFAGEPFIFNLGHGVLPDTPVENVVNLIECVRNYESRKFTYR